MQLLTSSSAKRKRRLSPLLVTVVLALAAALTVLSSLPEWILFRQRLLFSVLDLGDDMVLVPFDHTTHDGMRLRSWYIAPAEGRPMIVYFAGRDGDLLRKPAHLFELAQEGYGLLLVGYRGYGGNPGEPAEFDLNVDATYMLAQFSQTELADNGYILYGYSMGSAIAANAAAQVETRAVILEAPLSNFLEAVRQQAGGVPAWLVRTRFDNISRMAEIRSPVLLLAGGKDLVTPPLFALSLAAANPAMARVEVFDEANHFSIVRLGGRKAVRDFLEELETAPPVESTIVGLEVPGSMFGIGVSAAVIPARRRALRPGPGRTGRSPHPARR